MEFDWTIQISDIMKVAGVAFAIFYTINKIQNTTERLKSAIDHLTHAVEKIDGKTEVNTKDIGNIRERVAVIESKIETRYP
jgi:predicted  nucleic acid-binding Zn-ribbon protein